ncbi:MAG TPA: pentapeptide repeat-containing protein [Lentzea sp.]
MDIAMLPKPTQLVFHWRWVWLTLVLACLAGVVAGYLLWGTTTAEHRDAFDVGWKSSAAVLAVLATFITVDRLRLSQREHHRQLVVAHLTQLDLIARQITDLSAKASEQLGSDKAAVRIGGLTDLERLAQSHPELRQTVVDRLCAYLRAPFDPPEDTPSGDDDVARRLELDVRRTAQRILARHLQPAIPESFWEDINLDLRDAVLVDLNLDHCRAGDADFVNAKLHGVTSVQQATLVNALFLNATFSGPAHFTASKVTQFANFIEATFAGLADFSRATLEHAGFRRTTFSGHAVFTEATFIRAAFFSSADLAGRGYFEMAAFGGEAWFHHAAFAKGAEFAGAVFSGETSFEGATFADQAWFDGAPNTRGAGVDPEAAFNAAHWVAVSSPVDHLPAARFDGPLSLENARVTDPRQNHSWPAGWRPEPDRDEPGGPHLLVPKKVRKPQDS